MLSGKRLLYFGVRRAEAESIEGTGEGRSAFALFLLTLSFASAFEASSSPSFKEKGRCSSGAIALYEHRYSSHASRYYCYHRGGATAPSPEALLLPPSTCYFPSGIRARSASRQKITSLRGHDLGGSSVVVSNGLRPIPRGRGRRGSPQSLLAPRQSRPRYGCGAIGIPRAKRSGRVAVLVRPDRGG